MQTIPLDAGRPYPWPMYIPARHGRTTGGSRLRAGGRQNTIVAAQDPRQWRTARYPTHWFTLNFHSTRGAGNVTTYNVLILGASYGSLLATKLLFAGHKVKLVCLPAEADAINKDGARVRLPVKGRKELVEIDTRKLPGTLSAAGAGAVNPADYDLIGLAMQEPQYRSPGVRELLDAVAKSKAPCMSIMNMPPLPYVEAHPRPELRRAQAGLYRRQRVGLLRSVAGDAVQPRPAGVPSAGRAGQRAAGHAADQLQGRALRFRQVHRNAAPDGAGDRGRSATTSAAARRSSCRSSSRCTTRSSCRWPSGRCCSPATIAA